MKTPTLLSFVWAAIAWLPTTACGQEKEQFVPRREPLERGQPDVVRHRDDSGGPPQGQPRFAPEETRREVERLRSQLVELLNDGKGDEAAEVKQRISELERQLRRPERMDGPDRFHGPGGPDESRPVRMDSPDRFRGPGGPDQSELQRRLIHLEVAIDHLHRAGFHEPADQLNRQAERFREQLPPGNMGMERGGGGGPYRDDPSRDDGPRDFGQRERREERRVIIREEDPGLREELNEVRGEVRELHEALNELREHLKQEPK